MHCPPMLPPLRGLRTAPPLHAARSEHVPQALRGPEIGPGEVRNGHRRDGPEERLFGSHLQAPYGAPGLVRTQGRGDTWVRALPVAPLGGRGEAGFAGQGLAGVSPYGGLWVEGRPRWLLPLLGDQATGNRGAAGMRALDLSGCLERQACR